MELAHDLIEVVSRDSRLSGRGAHLVIPSIIGPVLATILVLNRVYWRISLVHTLGLDDLCITLSLVFLYLLCIVNVIAVDHGYGRPSNSLSLSDLHTALEMFYFDQIFYKFSINLTKLSILCLYLRIFSQPWFRRTCWASVCVIFAYGLASIVATVFQCTPIPHFWDKSTYPTGICINVTAFWYANAVYNIVTDVVILASVPGVVWNLKLPSRQKMGLTAVFGLGIFVFATSILRMTTLDRSSKAPDPTQGTLVSTMWTTIEASSAVVCACLPMVRTPVQRLMPRLFPSHNASGTGRKAPNAKGPAALDNEERPAALRGGAGRVAAVLVPASREDSLKYGDIGDQSHKGDIETGMSQSQQQSWPTRLSSVRGLDGLALGPQGELGGHKRLPSESTGCASHIHLEDW